MNNNREHLQALSGQKLWKRRLTVFDKLVTERAALMLGFQPAESAPTVPDEAASLVAAQEAEEAAKQQKLEDQKQAGKPVPNATAKSSGTKAPAAAASTG